jgi:hypothetical protein
LILFWGASSSAQVNFENGYYIDNNNSRFEGLIKNKDRRANPSKVIFKKDENEIIQELSIDKVKEFGIYNTSKFIRSTVNIDQSSQSINTLDKRRTPNFENKTVFLKSLIDGKSSL